MIHPVYANINHQQNFFRAQTETYLQHVPKYMRTPLSFY